MKIGLLVDSHDNVAVATSAIQQGDAIQVGDDIIIAKQAVPIGHKISIKDIGRNQYVYKYGVPIGLTNVEISKGEYMHTHNITDITEELCKGYIESFMKEEATNE
ncbi:MAG: UxaA family hydrolase [Sedimentibacter saalensis]|uniref:UxaA family hydrolase n=1 Tax=Sedimentibacter saalensis TaxID=130788 RepID=UPI0031594E5D